MDWEKFWDLLAWIGFGITIMYLIFKAFGIIHSPLTIDIVTIMGASIFIGRHIQKVEHISKEINFMKKDMSNVKKDINNVNNKINSIGSRVFILEKARL